MTPAQPAAKLEREKRLKSALGELLATARKVDINTSKPSAQVLRNDSTTNVTRF